MIRGDIEAIGHIPPRPRIDLNAVRPVEKALGPAFLEAMSIHEKNRIWSLVIEVSR